MALRSLTLSLIATFAASSCATSQRAARPAWRPAAAASPRAHTATLASQGDPPSTTTAASAPRWQCDLTDVALPSVSAELDVPSASIYADAVVGASLIVRERPERDRTRGSNFNAELNFRDERGLTSASKVVLGLPLLSAPWRIEDSRARVVRRCDAHAECEVFALGTALVFPQHVREGEPVFSLRIDGPDAVTAIAASDGARFSGAAIIHRRNTSSGFRATIPEGHTVVGIRMDGEQMSPLFRRASDGAIVSMEGETVALDDRPCNANASEPFAVVVLPMGLGTFGPSIEIRAEIALDGGETTCVKRLYGRGQMRLVESSVDVAVRGAPVHNGLLRTARSVSGLRCHAGT